MRKPIVALLACLAVRLPSAVSEEKIAATQSNIAVELSFTASRTYKDPFSEVTLDALFVDPSGKDLRVPAFWAGGNLWKVRYASPLVGRHTFRTECGDTGDVGLHDIRGHVEIKPYRGENPLYLHGPLRVAASRRYLEHIDGTPFFWLGDTWWMGLCHRLHWPDEFKKLAADRHSKGFNVIQIVAGLYPDMPPFDPRGANETGFPWENDYTRLRPDYFNAADERLAFLVESGFTPCIVGAWGYFIKFMGVEKARLHWRNLVARYGAWPVVWCIAGEANLPYYLAKGFPYDDREQVKDWSAVARYVRQIDPFHRLITIHPTGIGRLSARNAINDMSLLDFDMLQTPHGQREAVLPTIRTVRESYADKPVLPVINGEAAYEMLGDELPTEWTRQMFWLCMMNGAAGHTYGANGIWQVNRQGKPHGPSPHHPPGSVGYGAISWDEAMDLPGSKQVGLAKKLLEQFPWTQFQPHPEWVAAGERNLLSFDECQWIWRDEGKPAQNAPAEKRFFRKSFLLPEDATISAASLRISADDKFTVWLNGQDLGTAADWRAGKQFDDLARLLNRGRNVLAVMAENFPAPVPANPAGLIVSLQVHFAGEKTSNVVSDNTWLSSNRDTPHWETLAFNDAAWSKAASVARYGDAPWGRLEQRSNEMSGPQSAGMSNGVRIIYVPENEAAIVRNLTADRAYSATYFDPVSGARSAAPPVTIDATGSWGCPAPSGNDHDWVLILEPQSKVPAARAAR